MGVFGDILNEGALEKKVAEDAKTGWGNVNDIKLNHLSEVLVDGYHVDPEAVNEMGQLMRHLDPRPDLTADHEAWMIVLGNAALTVGMDKLHGTLHWLRCSGAGMERATGNLGFKLVSGKWDRTAAGMGWEDAKLLMLQPQKAKLVELFEICKQFGTLDHVFGPEAVMVQEKIIFREGK